jgi:hypothetical protein
MACFRDQTGLLSRKALKTRVLGPEFPRKTKKAIALGAQTPVKVHVDSTLN